MGDQVIPTNDTLRESTGSWGIGGLQDDAGMHVWEMFSRRYELPRHHTAGAQSWMDEAAVKLKMQTLMSLSLFFFCCKELKVLCR